MRRKFARQYGFVVPEIKLTDDIKAPAKTYQIRIHGTVVGDPGTARSTSSWSSSATASRPNVPGDEVREPAFGMKAMSISQAYRQGRQARGLQADRRRLGAADPSERGHPQQPRSAAVLQGHARPAGSAGARVQAAGRRAVPVADLLFRHCRRCSSCCWPSACRSATSASSSRRSPKSRRTCAGPSRSSSTCASGWRAT